MKLKNPSAQLIKSIELPNALIDSFKQENVVLFVGSGLSIDLGLPNWNQLVIEIISHIESRTNSDNLGLFKQLLETSNMDALDVLTQIEKKGHKKLAQDYIGNRLRLKDNCNLTLQKRIFAKCSRIITTNYDHAFEKALGDSVHKVSFNSIHSISNLSSKDEYIFKIHGDVDEPDNCILFESDYKKLYEQNGEREELLINQIKNLILNKTLVFIGFSFSDPYIKEIMDHIFNITKGTMSNHFLFTTSKDFNIPYIQPIVLEQYSDIDYVLKQIPLPTETDSEPKIKEDIEVETIEANHESTIPIINLLFSEPIDKGYNYNVDLFSRVLSKYELRLNITYLNLEQLRNIENGLVIIFSKTIKNKLIIEDEYLQSRQISHSELVENLSAEINGIFIVSNDYPQFNVENAKSPPCYYIIDENPSKIKRKLDTILFKLLKKRNDFHSTIDKKIGTENLIPFSFKKGKAIIINQNTNISRYLDKKLLANFVGRKTDVENIIRKIIDLEYESKILTIKGSGGIGKTTIIIKSVLELAQRQIYDSVQYVSCQSITSYDNFEYQMANCVNLDPTGDVIEQIRTNHFTKNTVIILDNFETLLQLNDKAGILNLVSIACDYFIIITTSRQLLDLDFEEVYELRNLTTDEGLELFKKYYKGNVETKEDEEVLRYEIIENLLNNNPLAIKIISKGIPKSKNLELLKNELKDNIFQNENINKIFEKPEDINIEKSSSLFYSIKYGFDKLNEKERFAFELLSLFPDGIHIENLKKFAKQKKDATKITDKEIKALDDKSLLENSRGFLKLQSILNRFSSYQFDRRLEKDKKKYYTLCFEYNSFFLNVLDQILTTSDSLQIHDDNINNYLKCIDFIEFVDKPNSEKLDYIDSLAYFFRHINQFEEFLEIIGQDKIERLFNRNEKEAKLYRLIILQLIYWCKDFSVVDEILEIYNKEELINLNFNDKIERLSYVKVLNILTCEGESLFSLKDRIDRWYLKNTIIDDLFRVGLVSVALDLVEYEPDKTFIEYDILLETGKLNLADLENYISKLYDKESLELIQISYVKLKYDPDTKIDTTRFIITNPYTKGMIYLIKAITSRDEGSTHLFFKTALKNLKHIKYYYVEAIYQYCIFLKKHKGEKYNYYVKKGIQVSVELNFWYLNFKFERLSNETLIYNESLIFNKLVGIERTTFDLFIEQYKNEHKANRKKK
ncbi:SIR2 family protein [Sediminicola luteus]|uniref:NB-ARC domain-containing protein n=1 Tax=Sediminicola luteus TaxID=319238 RepID=A0A2A4G742_9FLAO|nr:SIR2 family protein [Sediminicola luteus]PCE63774.1 hypothetical protein B7P33_10900 [Sediminicola luteus]